MTDDQGMEHGAATAEEPDEPDEQSKQDGKRQQSGGKQEEGEESESPGTRLSVHEIHENITSAAEEELERPAKALLFSALGSGLTIGFSFLAGSFLSSLVEDEKLKEAMVALAYPIGFVFVVLARNQLFTEQTLEPVLPFLEHPSRDRFARLLRLWGLVLFANLVGAIVLAMLLAWTPMLERDLLAAMDDVARKATVGGFGSVFYKAIYAGWLVALMAWLIAATESSVGQILLIWLSTAPIAAFGFRHSIAGSVEAFYRAARHDAPWGTMIGEFIVPAVLGNIVGGVLFVALLNHGQVAADKKGEANTSGE